MRPRRPTNPQPTKDQDWTHLCSSLLQSFFFSVPLSPRMGLWLPGVAPSPSPMVSLPGGSGKQAAREESAPAQRGESREPWSCRAGSVLSPHTREPQDSGEDSKRPSGEPSPPPHQEAAFGARLHAVTRTVASVEWAAKEQDSPSSGRSAPRRCPSGPRLLFPRPTA